MGKARTCGDRSQGYTCNLTKGHVGDHKCACIFWCPVHWTNETQFDEFEFDWEEE